MLELHRKRQIVFLDFYTLCSLLSATDNNGRVWDSGAHEERHSHDYRSVVRWTLNSTPGSLWPNVGTTKASQECGQILQKPYYSLLSFTDHHHQEDTARTPTNII